MTADAATIARAMVEQARQYLPLASEVESSLKNDAPDCARLASLIGIFRATPNPYAQLSKRFWQTRTNPGLEKDFYQYIDAYDSGFEAFRQQIFEDIRTGCAAGRAPSAAQRENGLKWMQMTSTVSKFEHIVNELSKRIGG